MPAVRRIFGLASAVRRICGAAVYLADSLFRR